MSARWRARAPREPRDRSPRSRLRGVALARGPRGRARRRRRRAACALRVASTRARLRHRTRRSRCGWDEVVVRVQNNGGKPARGRRRGRRSSQYGRRRARLPRHGARSACGAGRVVHVRVPARGRAYGDADASTCSTRTARSSRETTLRLVHRRRASLLVDVERAVAPPRRRERGGRSRRASAPAASSTRRSGAARRSPWASPRVDPATGDPVLPERAALYARRDAVVMRSDVPRPPRRAPSSTRSSGGCSRAARSPIADRAPGGPAPPDARRARRRAPSRAGRRVSAADARASSPLPARPPRTPDRRRKTHRRRGARRPPTRRRPRRSRGLSPAATSRGSALRRYGARTASARCTCSPSIRRARPPSTTPGSQARMVDLARRAFDRRATHGLPPGRRAATAPRTRRGAPSSSTRTRTRAGPSASRRSCSSVYSIVAGPAELPAGRARRGRPLGAAAVAARHRGDRVRDRRRRRPRRQGRGAGERGTSRSSRPAPGCRRGTARRFRGFSPRAPTRAHACAPRTPSSVVSSAVVHRRTRGRRASTCSSTGTARASRTSRRSPGRRWSCARTASPSSATGSRCVEDGDGTSSWSTARAASCANVDRLGAEGGRVLLRPHRDGERVTSPRRAHAVRPADGADGTADGARRRTRRLDRPARASAHALTAVLEPTRRASPTPGGPSSDAAGDDGRLVAGRRAGPARRARRRRGRESTDSGLRVESDRLLVRVVGEGGARDADARPRPAARSPRASRPTRPSACATSGTASASSTCCAT